MRYSSDLSDKEWTILSPLLTADNHPGGRRSTYPLREVINAILYISVNGCKWHDLPDNFPPYMTVYYHYKKFKKRGILDRIHRYFLKGGASQTRA